MGRGFQHPISSRFGNTEHCVTNDRRDTLCSNCSHTNGDRNPRLIVDFEKLKVEKKNGKFGEEKRGAREYGQNYIILRYVSTARDYQRCAMGISPG